MGVIKETLIQLSMCESMCVCVMQWMCDCTYADQQGWNWCAVFIMNHGQQTGQVTFSSSRETQPASQNIIGQPIRSKSEVAKHHDRGKPSHLEEVKR